MPSDHHTHPIPPITLTVPTPPGSPSSHQHHTNIPSIKAPLPSNPASSPSRPGRESPHHHSRSDHNAHPPRSQANNALDLPLLRLEHLVLSRLHAYIASLHPTSSLARFAVQEVEKEVRKLEGWLGELEPEVGREKEREKREGGREEQGSGGGRALPSNGEERERDKRRRTTSPPPNVDRRASGKKRIQRGALLELLFPPRKAKRRTYRDDHARTQNSASLSANDNHATRTLDREAHSALRHAVSQLVDRVARDVGHDWASMASSSSSSSDASSSFLSGPESTHERGGRSVTRSSSADVERGVREDGNSDVDRDGGVGWRKRRENERRDNAEDRNDHGEVRRDYDVGTPLRRHPTTHRDRRRDHDRSYRGRGSRHGKHSSRNRSPISTRPRRRASRKLHKNRQTNRTETSSLPSVHRNALGQALDRVLRALFNARDRDKRDKEENGRKKKDGGSKRQDKVRERERAHQERRGELRLFSPASHRSRRHNRSRPASHSSTSSHAPTPKQRRNRRSYRGLRISSPDMDVEIDLDGSEAWTMTGVGRHDDEQAERRRRGSYDESLAPSDSVSMRETDRLQSRSRRV